MTPPNPPNASPQSLRAIKAAFGYLTEEGQQRVALIIDREFAPLLAAVGLCEAELKKYERCLPSDIHGSLRNLVSIAHPHATATGGEKEAK